MYSMGKLSITNGFTDEGLRVVTAIMAIIVLAIAVQFLIDGVGTAVPQV